jgi:hypothetical protein
VDTRADLDDVEKILDPTGTRTPTPLVVQPVANPVTGIALPLPFTSSIYVPYYYRVKSIKHDNICNTWFHQFST